MPEPTTGLAVAEKTDKILAGLRSVPIWVSFAIAATAAVVVFYPAFASIHFAEFRKQFGPYIFTIGILALFLAAFRIIDVLANAAWRKHKDAKAKQVLTFRVGPDHLNCWGQVQRSDGQFSYSHITLTLKVLNTSSTEVSLAHVDIIKPKRLHVYQSGPSR
jgi:hypothetical protein